MKLFFKKQKGFTLIEILVVMAIIAILMPMGINALINIRNARVVADTVNNVRNTIKDARSRALSVSVGQTEGEWPVGYEVSINDNGFNLYTIFSNSSQYVSWEDRGSEVEIKEISSTDFNDVLVNSGRCNRVVFSSVDGEMFIYSDELLVTDLCTIEFSFGGKKRMLKLESSSKTFEIE